MKTLSQQLTNARQALHALGVALLDVLMADLWWLWEHTGGHLPWNVRRGLEYKYTFWRMRRIAQEVEEDLKNLPPHVTRLGFFLTAEQEAQIRHFMATDNLVAAQQIILGVIKADEERAAAQAEKAEQRTL